MTRLKSSAPFLTFGFVALLTQACTPLRAPFQSTGPSVSPEGVQVIVAREYCDQTSEPDFYGNDLVEAKLEIELRNHTAVPVGVHRDAFRLVAPDGAALKTISWNVAEPLTVPEGMARKFELRFMVRGSLECAREMKLDVDSGVTMRDRPIQLGSIRFVPARSI